MKQKPIKKYCPRCRKLLRPGKALATAVVGIPDFIGSKDVCTVSSSGTGKLIDCLKCPKCGFSVTK